MHSLMRGFRVGVAMGDGRTAEDIARTFDRQGEAMVQSAWFLDAQRARELLEFARLSPGERVLEVGCGPGIVLEHAARMAGILVAVDLSVGMLRKARARAAAAHRVRGVVERLPFRHDTFDLAYCRSVIHHVLDPAAMVKDMARVVRPGGRVVINDSVASEDPEEARAHNRVEVLRDPSHGRMLPPSELRSLVTQTGLRIEEVWMKRFTKSVDEWLDVASPPAEARSGILGQFEAWTRSDGSGLRPWREGGRLFFEHAQWTIRARKP